MQALDLVVGREKAQTAHVVSHFTHFQSLLNLFAIESGKSKDLKSFERLRQI
jgi:hypothetical protein